jgi:RNA polymerase sigma-70 factor (ECF subfamily)
VDRYIGVVYHVIQHSAGMRSVQLRPEEIEDLAADVMATIVDANFKILRRFRGKSSMASYLAVIARRVVVNKLGRRAIYEKRRQNTPVDSEPSPQPPPEAPVDNEDEVRRLLELLDGQDADLVRAYYLEHKTYAQISSEFGIPENSIGPTLSRLREQLRKTAPQR